MPLAESIPLIGKNIVGQLEELRKRFLGRELMRSRRNGRNATNAEDMIFYSDQTRQLEETIIEKGMDPDELVNNYRNSLVKRGK